MLRRLRTLGDVLLRTGGELRGLFIARAALVAVLIGFQSVAVSQSFGAVLSTPLWIAPAVAPSALFAMLGLAMAQSRVTDTTRTFLLRRARHGLPALVAAVVLTVLVIGPVSTISPLRRYLLDQQTGMYLLNILGLPQFSLPGVFAFNDLPGLVNVAMWMVPVFMLLTLAIAFVPPDRRPRTWLGLTALPFGMGIALPAVGGADGQFVGAALGALLCGLLGAAGFGWRARVPIDWRLAAASVTAIGGAAVVGTRFWAERPDFQALIALPVAYLALWASSTDFRTGQPSAGWGRWLLPALLIAFPVQQAVVALGPRAQNAAVNLALSFPAILLFTAIVAYLSGRREVAGAARSHPWLVVPPGQRRRRVPLRDRVRQVAIAMLLGLVLLAVSFAMLALAFIALQRDDGGL